MLRSPAHAAGQAVLLRSPAHATGQAVLLRSPAHAAGQAEGRGDGGEDGDDHVDNQLPGLFLAFL